MIHKTPKFLSILALAACIGFPLAAHAQDPQRAATAASKPATAQLSVAPKGSNPFPRDVQAALEAGNTHQAKQLCGQPCKKGSPKRLSAGQAGETRDYECQNGNCACTSIPDCVAMTEVCAPGTTGCNDYGCTCAEKPAEEPDP